MFKLEKINHLDDYFCMLSSRDKKGVYVCRVCNYSDEIKDFIKKYYQVARKNGVIIEGKIANPDEKNLAYFSEVMGMQFKLDLKFFDSSLKKWLPRMSDYARENVSKSLYSALCELRDNGKNDNMLKNAYIKFMCWMYYKFERIANRLGADDLPKILYEGTISNYELILISVLASAGCDVLLLQYKGDQEYLKIDPSSQKSQKYDVQGGSFPIDFSMKLITKEIQSDMNRERLYGERTKYKNCTNAWISGKGFEDFLKSFQMRGESDKDFYYNCFYRIRGVEDKLTYINELSVFYTQMNNLKRKMVVVDGEIAKPTMEEISQIHRKNYHNNEEALMDLLKNIEFSQNKELQKLMIKVFIDVLLELSEKDNLNTNRFVNLVVYLLCWMKRFQSELFGNWKFPEIGCFVHFGSCKTDIEVAFLKILARLPVDVLVLVPNQDEGCILEDKLLYELRYSESMIVDKFPCGDAVLNVGTVAYHAERELDTIMYQDSGIYRNQQFSKAEVIVLKTMYEEIKILWDQELKFRPNFDTVDNVVKVPVIFSKISGVKNGDISQYWKDVKSFMTEDTILINKYPYIDALEENPVKAHATVFLKRGKLQKQKIKESSCYQYGFLREETQDYILEKLQLLIDHKIIKGTYENGTEYTIISTVLNLPKDITRLIQKFDFTKKNGKIMFVNTKEDSIALEDTIMFSFLNLIGLDIIFWVPTGYQTIEKHLNRLLIEEHQIGEYMYDLQIPDINSVLTNSRTKWTDKIFKRGR
ncbi:MAG: YceG family protein [Lachnospiraceae bacterium]|nr:YceG family protein [Lachnospiraceae bacterium]